MINEETLRDSQEICRSTPSIDTGRLKSLLENQGVEVDDAMSSVIDYLNPARVYAIPQIIVDHITQNVGPSAIRIAGAEMFGRQLGIDGRVIDEKLCTLEYHGCIVETDIDIKPKGVNPSHRYKLSFTREIRTACPLD